MKKKINLEIKKPTVEQVEYIFKKLNDHIKEGGTFRYLIYNRLGFNKDAYSKLYLAGGMNISNKLNEQSKKINLNNENKIS